MNKLFAFCTARPRAVLLAAAASVLLALPGLASLELGLDGQALRPPGDPAVLYDAEVRNLFEIDDPLVVTLTTGHPDGIFNRETLAGIRDLTAALRGIDGIDANDVVSLGTERRDRVWPGTLDFRKFLDPLPEDQAAMDVLREDVRAVGILHGTLVSYDERSAAVVLGFPPGTDRAGLLAAVRAAASESVPADHDLRIVGAPVAESELGFHILGDLATLLPLVLLVTALAIHRLMRSVWVVLLSAGEAMATIVVTFGVMGYAGVPVYITTAILPVVLASMAIADDLHVVGDFLGRLRMSETPAPDATEEHHLLELRATLSEIWPAVVTTSVTTGIGFLSFAVSSIPSVRAFGVFLCFGILYAMAWSLTVTPAALAALGPRRLARDAGREAREPRLTRALRSLVHWIVARPRAVLLTIGILVAATPAGIAAIEVRDGWIEGFAPASPLRRATAFVEEHFHGTHVLLVTLDAGPTPDALIDPTTLEKVGRLEARLRELPGVGGVLGPATHLATMRHLLRARAPGARGTPDSIEEARRVVHYLGRLRGQRRSGEILGPERRRGVISVLLENANFVDTARIMGEATRHAERELTPAGIGIDFAGDVGVSQAMIAAIVHSQVFSLALTLAGVGAVAWALTRSLAHALCCALPAGCAAAMVLAFMGAAGIPLGVATSMLAAITVGVGVDYAVHLSLRVRRATRAGKPLSSAIEGAMDRSGRTIAIDALAVAAGFSLLALSATPANVRLGALVATGVGASCFLTVVGLPALLCAWKPAFLER